MSTTASPVPSKHYQELQRKLQHLLDDAGPEGRNAGLSIEEQLEAEFVRAWGFADDTTGQAQEMQVMAALTQS